MPQDGSNNYQYPPGTPGIPDQTIESEAYNTFLDDLVVNDLNIARPIHRGGTGAITADAALAALGGEKSSQSVINYNSHIWLPGSFYSATSATGAPINGVSFSGWVYSSDAPQTPPLNQNVVVHAYDTSSTPRPGRLYTKEKKAGVWSGWVVETNISTGPTPPTGMRDGALWWDNDNGVLYINYDDGNTTQWVQVVPLPAIDTTVFVQRGGDIMTGPLTLSGEPTVDLHAATKLYVDAGVGGVGGGLSAKVAKNGDVMTGLLTLSGEPTADLHAATKLYVDAGVGGVGGGLSAKVAKNGDVMTGLLTLSGDPTSALHAATKQYVDTKGSRVSLAGGRAFDIPVPAGALAARMKLLIVPTSGADIDAAVQISVQASVFLTAGYHTYGYIHQSVSNTLTPLHDINTNNIALIGTHINNTLPFYSDGTVQLTRNSLAHQFTGCFSGVSYLAAVGMKTGFFYTYVTPAAGLNVLALRVLSATGDNWGAGSYVNVEWL